MRGGRVPRGGLTSEGGLYPIRAPNDSEETSMSRSRMAIEDARGGA